MKIQKQIWWTNLDIDLIPKIQLRVSVPNILNMKYKWQYREISLGFGWLGLRIIIQINF